MGEMSWRDAITKVLAADPTPMHYTGIADAIAEQGLKTKVGATPAQTINATITMSIKNEGEASPFLRVDVGRYALRAGVQIPQPSPGGDEDAVDTGLICGLGMYWSRANISWDGTPRLLGRQTEKSTPVDFYEQEGVYLLYDRRDVVYVGRTTKRPLGLRLKEHTRDRLSGRWERFSWFGVYPVTEEGKLDKDAVGTFDVPMLVVTMEALLIEGLEPPQNRKRGDGFRAVEFLQVEDPEIQRQQAMRLFESIKAKF